MFVKLSLLLSGGKLFSEEQMDKLPLENYNALF